MGRNVRECMPRTLETKQRENKGNFKHSLRRKNISFHFIWPQRERMWYVRSERKWKFIEARKDLISLLISNFPIPCIYIFINNFPKKLQNKTRAKINGKTFVSLHKHKQWALISLIHSSKHETKEVKIFFIARLTEENIFSLQEMAQVEFRFLSSLPAIFLTGNVKKLQHIPTSCYALD